MMGGTLPKVSEIMDLWHYEERPLHPGEFEDGVEPDDARFQNQYHEKYDRKMKLSLWYFDDYMTMIAGSQYWGNDTKTRFLPTDMMDIEGEQKVIVTITSEAFGILLYENCRDKWIEKFKWKDENPRSNKKSKPPPNTTRKSRRPTPTRRSGRTTAVGNQWGGTPTLSSPTTTISSVSRGLGS